MEYPRTHPPGAADAAPEAASPGAGRGPFPRAAGDWEPDFRGLIENITDVVARFDRELRHLYVSPAVERATGRPAAEFIGRTNRELGMPAALADQWDEVTLRVFRTGEPAECQFRFDGPGGPQWFESRMFPERDPSGAVATVISMARDVTERQASAEALRRSQAFFQAAIDALSAHVAVLDENGRVLHVNVAWSRFAEANGADARTVGVGVDYLDACERAGTPEAVETAARIRAVLAGGLDEHVSEYSCHSPDERRWFVMRVTRFGGDGPARVVVAHENVTATVLSDIARRESEANARAMFENSLDGVMLMTPAGGILSANPAACRMFGRSEEELVRLGRGAILDMDDPAIAAVSDERRRNARFSGRVELLRADGSRFPAELSAARFLDEAGRPRATVVVRDVTDEVRAAEALRASEERFRALTENASDLTSILAPDGTIQYVSPSVRWVLGYDQPELLGTSTFDLLHPDDRARVAERLGAAMGEPGKSVSSEFRLRHADGSYVDFEGVGTNLCHLPAVGGIVTNSRDITARRRAEAALRQREEELRQAQKMEAVGRLAGGIAHDFNNLLTAIKGNTELLLVSVDEDSPLLPELREVAHASDRAAALTRQLLAFSRRQVLHPEVLSLNDVVRGMQNMLRRLLGEAVELEAALDPALPRVRVDPGQLEQVVLNLAVNARDAMPRGGILTVATSALSADEAEAAGLPARALGYARLAVTDTGEGIDADVLPHVFEPFFTTKEMGKGTGLGLSTVYGIVQQSEGRIDVASVPGRGTTFTVYLPAAEEVAAPEPPAPAPEARRPGGEVVLLVEDDDAVRLFTRRVLERGGFAVLEARNGMDALRIAAEAHALDVMLTDVVMPRLSGRELAVQICSIHPQLRVLYMSGYPGDEMASQGLVEPDTPFLEKPFTVDALLARLREVLSS